MAKKTFQNRSWHPDFRIVEDLPDVKAVRTGFLINTIVVLLLIIVVGQTVYRHVTNRDIIASNEVLQSEINAKSQENKKILSLNKSFLKNRQALQEFETYYSNPFSPDQLLNEISSAQQDDILLKQFNCSLISPPVKKGRKSKKAPKVLPFYRLRFTGVVEQDSTSSLQTLENFITSMRTNEILNKDEYVFDVEVSNYQAAAGNLPFVITIDFKN